MTCYHPLHAFKIGINIETQKPHYIITSSKVESIPRPIRKLYHTNEKVNVWDYRKNPCWEDNPIKTFIEIPCGKCIGCRLAYSKQWAQRLMLENKTSTNSQFITLTYNDENLTYNKGINIKTGEIVYNPTLVKKDLQLFIKKLRRHYDYHKIENNIRYFACGEYGDEHNRPHYHLIVFNCPIQDKTPKFKNKLGQTVYTSKLIEKLWGKGLISVANVTYNSCAYVARYMLKKQKGISRNIYKLQNIQEEFTVMSRNPGIANEYFKDNYKDIYETDMIFLQNYKGKLIKAKPNTYYDKMYDKIEPESLEKIKIQRQKCAKNLNSQKEQIIGLPIDEIRKLEESNQNEKIKFLPRKFEKK